MSGRRQSPVTAQRPRPTAVRTRGSPGSRAADRTSTWRRFWLLGAGAVALLALAGIAIVVVGWPGQTPPDSAGGNVTVGTAVGQRPPDFRLTDIDGRTVARDALVGEPAIVWFTTSYCAPCQEGALSLQRVLGRIGGADKVAVVMVFVDPGEPSDALALWRSRFGRSEWITAYADPSMIADYRVQALDTKYLVDRDGLIRLVDLVPLQFQEDAWERELRSVIGG